MRKRIITKAGRIAGLFFPLAPAALAQSKHVLAGYEALLRDAIDAGELIPCDVKRVARSVQALVSGSLFTWAIHRTGRATAFVARNVETLLTPLRTTR